MDFYVDSEYDNIIIVYSPWFEKKKQQQGSSCSSETRLARLLASCFACTQSLPVLACELTAATSAANAWAPGTGSVDLTHRSAGLNAAGPTVVAFFHAVSDPFHRARPTRIPSPRRRRRPSRRHMITHTRTFRYLWLACVSVHRAP